MFSEPSEESISKKRSIALNFADWSRKTRPQDLAIEKLSMSLAEQFQWNGWVKGLTGVG